ncbi:MAG: class I SAM-dependent methyltransferase [Planctomycetota bacterium]|nr:class I SAM-dependent methyltransferase [Planctomycetota bacterium]
MERSTVGFDSVIAFRNSQNLEARGTLIHVTRNVVVFEVYNPYSVVQLSEVLHDLRIMRGERVIYSGRAVVSSIVATGVMLIVSATLVDPWSDLAGVAPGRALTEEVRGFVRDWETSFRIRPSYQLVVGSIAGFFAELNRWLNHAEAAGASGDSLSLQEELALSVEAGLTDKLGSLFGTFEAEAAQVAPEEAESHKAFARRQMHPLMLVSPFIHRTFTKPLGYAGDYEMVNMIVRSPLEGPNTYARVLNAAILRSKGAQAHRNRIDRLVHYLKTEARRVTAMNRPLRVLNIGCGPAVEVQQFVRSDSLSDDCELHLMDFNRETLAYARQRLVEASRESGHSPAIIYHHKSVNELLKEASREALGQGTIPFVTADLVYCAGLFDYLSDRICKRLLQLFSSWTRPGGLVVATNVHPRNDVRYFLEHVLEWNLIYRDEKQMEELAPDGGTKTVNSESTGMNVFLEIRKPETR